MDELSNYYKHALLHGLCDEYKGLWRRASGDKERLVRLAMMQQSIPHVMAYSAAGSGLSKDYILGTFGDYVNGRYVGIDVDGVEGLYRTELYVGYDGTIDASDDVLAVMWSSPFVSVPESKAVKIYCGCHSDVRLSCCGYDAVKLMVFDDSTVTIDDADDTCVLTAYLYGEGSSVERGKYCIAEPRVFKKELKL